jgi:hypothetical protein
MIGLPLFLLKPKQPNGPTGDPGDCWDFNSAVVAAENAEAAVLVFPEVEWDGQLPSWQPVPDWDIDDDDPPGVHRWATGKDYGYRSYHKWPGPEDLDVVKIADRSAYDVAMPIAASWGGMRG